MCFLDLSLKTFTRNLGSMASKDAAEQVFLDSPESTLQSLGDQGGLSGKQSTKRPSFPHVSGEGPKMYDVAASLSDMMVELGICIDGGKDSLSMAARLPKADGTSETVKSPGQPESVGQKMKGSFYRG